MQNTGYCYAKTDALLLAISFRKKYKEIHFAINRWCTCQFWFWLKNWTYIWLNKVAKKYSKQSLNFDVRYHFGYQNLLHRQFFDTNNIIKLSNWIEIRTIMIFGPLNSQLSGESFYSKSELYWCMCWPLLGSFFIHWTLYTFINMMVLRCSTLFLLPTGQL